MLIASQAASMLLIDVEHVRNETCNSVHVAVRVPCMRFASLVPVRTLKTTDEALHRNIYVHDETILKEDVLPNEQAFVVANKDVLGSSGKVVYDPVMRG